MVQVKISDGMLEGQVVEDELAGKYYSFKGIPYAAPPVDELRFKAPQPVTPWNGVKSAKEFGSPCFQFNMLTHRFMGSEDCLFLNVYTPEITPDKPLPVMVWIHGGGFIWGSGDDDWYGPEFLVKQGIILVTLNYRLGALGFLCLDSEDVPGNAGMKDQVAALRWVQKNISNFGGDPQNVTIFGESAGGASVSYHLVSPMSKGLFKRAITQSGSATCWWAYALENRETALVLARRLDFYSEDNDELYTFLKKQPVENLMNKRFVTNQLGKEDRTVFTIVDEKDFGSNERFFFGHPYDVLRNGGIHEGVDVVTGYTEDEGVFGLTLFDLNSVMDNINHLSEYLAPEPITAYCPASHQLEFGRRLRKHYFGQKKATLENVNQVFKYLSLNIIIYGVIQWAKIASMNAKKNKIYLYRFSCKSERNIMTNFFGLQKYFGDKTIVSHCDDLLYLFPFKTSGLKVEKGTESYELIENVTKLWTNFAKYGHPTPDVSLHVKWTPYDLENGKYLDLGNQLRISSQPDAEEIKIWEDLVREFYPKYVH